MSALITQTPTQEREARVMTGWIMLPVTIALYIAGPVLIVLALVNGTTDAGGGVQEFLAGAATTAVAI